MDTQQVPTRYLAGVAVADTATVGSAIDYARNNCEPYLFNHVARSWLFATRIGQMRNIEHDSEVLALGTLLHDIMLNERFAGPRRFEVEGADVARMFATSAGLDTRRAQLIWDSVALHSTASIALYKEPEVALCTAGVMLDAIGLQYDVIAPSEMRRILAEFPRLHLKHKMTRCVCAIARERPETTYDNFVRDFGERFVNGYEAPSAVDRVMNAPFDD